jgi:hypothetical protein
LDAILHDFVNRYPDVNELLDPAVFMGVAEDGLAAAVVGRLQFTPAKRGANFSVRPTRVPAR